MPEMVIDDGLEWHAFFSYVWNTGQDQCQLIKQQLLLLLPEARLFLDLDDLDDLSLIESHVADSQCVLLFLSRGFFHSNHCLREVRAMAAGTKPLVLVHESDESRGGAPLERLKMESADSGFREYVFNAPAMVVTRGRQGSGGGVSRLSGKGGEGEPREVISWHRLADFQLVSLKHIAAAVLHSSPPYQGFVAMPRLYVPEEVGESELEFEAPLVVSVSSSNAG